MSGTPPAVKPGEIITFYSYKGGAGRSMALANIACLLAAEVSDGGRGVLMVDWDLEAPGLHRYFEGAFEFRGKEKTATEERLLDHHPGLLNMFSDIMVEMPHEGYGTEDEAAESAAYLAKRFSPMRYTLPLKKVPNLYLLKAGRFDDEYSNHVNAFDWEGLHRRSPRLIRALAEHWAEEFEYVLIDSRTGLTDTSGICTMLMPEKLVVVFTPNRQSFTGVENLIRKASRYRKRSDDLRPLIVFPLPSRIEAAREDLRQDWRFGAGKDGVTGYQPLFERLFKDVYGLSDAESDLREYFDEVQIQQTADYAYGEEVAVLIEQQRDRFSLARSYQTFARQLVGVGVPWRRLPEEQGPQSSDDRKRRVLERANAFYSKLPPSMRPTFFSFLSRLVRIASAGEGEQDTAARAKLSDLKQEVFIADIRRAEAAGMVIIRGEGGDGATVEAADEALVCDWLPFRDWMEGRRDFLRWRQKLDDSLDEWEKDGRNAIDLLSGTALTVAKKHLERRPEDLNEAETAYIRKSDLNFRNLRRRLLIRSAVITLALGIGALFSWFLLSSLRDSRMESRGLSVNEWKKTGKVHIFYAIENEATAANELGLRLENDGYQVSQIYLRDNETDSTIIYYFRDDGEQAALDIGKIGKFLPNPPRRLPVAAPGVGYIPKEPAQNDPTNRGRIEIWLPSLQARNNTSKPR
jgi:cellulose biosynthesis protein BcsQ